MNLFNFKDQFQDKEDHKLKIWSVQNGIDIISLTCCL
jgi:hypothetical protein